MGTRGLIGFRRGGVDKLTYNHFDSYPEYLGEKVLQFIVQYREELDSIFDKIVLVNETDKPTQEQIEACKNYTNLGVSTGSCEDWYCLLRNAQGDLSCYANGLKYMIDNHDFINDTLFCEYAYIINLDTKCLEYYGGEYIPNLPTQTYDLADIHEEQINDIVENMREAVKFAVEF